jgi:imidazoleglycerol phosphate dehydratase HisB
MRTATITRATRETTITCTVNLDGTGEARIATGIGFLDHMLTALSKHSGIDIDLACTGDLHIDDHHTAEDCALTIGQALDQALASRLGITRFASAYAPLDESLARAVLDLSGRPLAVVNLMLLRDSIGTLAAENVPHFFRSLATTLRATLHLDILRGENDHHKAEAAFKALALALKQAVARTASTDVPSTKGSL